MTIFTPTLTDDDDLIGAKLAALAIKIADEASTDDIGLEARIDAFKVLTTYYVNTTKIGARADPEPDDGVPTFEHLQQRLQAAASRA
jgi:hypothetical protein